jgi:hypothetical protein
MGDNAVVIVYVLVQLYSKIISGGFKTTPQTQPDETFQPFGVAHTGQRTALIT